MPAAKSGKTYFYRRTLLFFKRSFQKNIDAGSSGTADKKNPFFFIINIDQIIGFQIRRIQYRRTFHPDFLIHRDHGFQCRMCQRIICKNSKNVGECNSIIAAKCRFFRFQPVSVNLKIQSFRFKIMGIVFADTNHIHMSLHHNGLSGTTVRGSRFPENDISAFFLAIGYSAFFCKLYQIIADFLIVVGTSWYL